MGLDLRSMVELSNQTVISCAGAVIKGAVVPQFDLHRGSIVTLRLPVTDVPIVDDLAEVLAGLRAAQGVRVFDKVAIATLPTERRRSWWPWSRDSPLSYLVKTFGIKERTANDLLARLRLLRFRDFRMLPQGPRVLIALEGALATAAACVFCSDGLDPENLGRAYDFVSDRARLGACIIELSTPYYVDNDVPRIDRWNAHPRGTSLNVKKIEIA